jgi:hypothetical protein
MKDVIIIFLLCSMLVLVYAGSRGGVYRSEVQCPTLDELQAERDAKEKQERLDRAKDRREKVLEELHKFIDP